MTQMNGIPHIHTRLYLQSITTMSCFWFSVGSNHHHSYNRYINDRVKATSNCRASDGNAIKGSRKSTNKPVNTDSMLIPAIILRFHLLLFHIAHVRPGHVLPMIFSPSAACNATHTTRPPYSTQLRQGHLCRPNFTNSKSSIDESGGYSRWIAKWIGRNMSVP